MNEVDSSHAQGGTQPRHVLLAVSIGNMLEWYDFAVYGFLTPVIARIMFPSGDPTEKTVQTLLSGKKHRRSTS